MSFIVYLWQKNFLFYLPFKKWFFFFFRVQNALLSALPYLVMWILSLLVAQFADLTARRGWATTNVIRKTANTIGVFIYQIECFPRVA